MGKRTPLSGAAGNNFIVVENIQRVARIALVAEMLVTVSELKYSLSASICLA